MTERPDNELLQALSGEDFNQLAKSLRPLELEAGTVLYEPEDRIELIWFPETGLISIVSTMLSGDSVETSMIGQEGGVGLIEACGSGLILSRARVQVSGRFQCLPAKAYCDCFETSTKMRSIVQRYVERLLIESRQLAVCHARHRVEKRLAWLMLQMQDRLGGRVRLPITHDALADIVAVQRTTVTQFASKLREGSIIVSRRGSTEILDRGRLEEAACECYVALRKAQRRALNDTQLLAV